MTPTEMEADPSIRGLDVLGDDFLIGTCSTSETAKVARMDLNDCSQYQVAVTDGVTVKRFARTGDDVYFAADGGLCHCDLAANSVSRVATDAQDPNPALGCHLG